MTLSGDWAEVVDHLNSAKEYTMTTPKKINPKKIAVRAAVTFVQVAIGVLIGKGLLDVSADTLDIAVMSGAGSALSVIYNAATQWLEATADES